MTSIARIPRGPNPRRRAARAVSARCTSPSTIRIRMQTQPSLLLNRMQLGWIDDHGRPIRPERPFCQGARHDNAAARQTTNVTPRGFRPAHVNGVLALERVRVGAVLVVRERANRGVEDQEVHDLRAIAPSDALVVGWAWKRALNQPSGERNRRRPIMVTGIADTRSGDGLRAGGDEDDD